MLASHTSCVQYDIQVVYLISLCHMCEQIRRLSSKKTKKSTCWSKTNLILYCSWRGPTPHFVTSNGLRDESWIGVCCWHQLPSVLSRPAVRQHTRELMSTTHTYPWLIPIITWCWPFPFVSTNILLIKSKLKLESRAIAVGVAMPPRYPGGKYRCRPHYNLNALVDVIKISWRHLTKSRGILSVS